MTGSRLQNILSRNRIRLGAVLPEQPDSDTFTGIFNDKYTKEIVKKNEGLIFFSDGVLMRTHSDSHPPR